MTVGTIRKSTPRARARSWRFLGAAFVLLVGGLAGCSREPSAALAADAFAAALAAGDLAGVPLTGDAAAAQADLTAAIAGMRGVRPEVSVADVNPGEDGQGTTVLDVRWRLPAADADPWSYRTRARLELVDDAWRVEWARDAIEPSLGPSDRLVFTTAAARRGEITGAGGGVLVTERGVLRLGIDKTKLPADAAASSARSLARLLDIDAAGYERRVRAAGPVAFVEALTLRTEEAQTYTDERFAAIPGATGIVADLPLSPTRTFARTLLGTVGEATAEIVAASNGRLRPGDVAGLSGLQAAHDAGLRGTSGYAVQVRPDEGRPGQARTLVERAAVPGAPLATTLDRDLQILAETVLEDVKPASAIVALRATTGEILAAANGPGSQGYATATQGRYAPGSTFKIVSALGLIRGGVGPGAALPCTATVRAAGRSFKNYDDYPSGALGTIPLRTVIAQSCNTALIASRGAAPAPALSEAAAALGLGQTADIGVEAFLGSVPSDVGETEHAASMIGQGKVEASPLAMAVVAASAASGRTVTPILLPESPPAQTDDRLSDGEADALRQLLAGVVSEGSARFLADVPGPPIGAKTGTAEYGRDNPPKTHAWMIATRDDMAVAVFVEQGASGSRTAGPLLERFLRGADAR